MSTSSMLEAIKIQSRVVIPIVKALEREIGRERAHAIVGEAIGQAYVEYRRRRGFEVDVHPGQEADAPAFPVEQTEVEHGEGGYGFNVTACAFAQYFRAIGEPAIGALMTCGVDFAAEPVLRPGWTFERTQTLMQGAPHCDFRWRRRPDGDEGA